MLLAVDTSSRKIGIALYDGVQILHEAVWQSPNHHTRELAPAIDDAMNHTGIKIDDLQVISVALGPGSFTGLRIGLALVKGLALARNLPLIGIPTFDILAAAQPVKKIVLAAVIEAGRSRLAVGWYQGEKGEWKAKKKKTELLTPKLFSKRIRTPTLICGELSESLQKLLGRKRKNVTLVSPARSLRRPAFLAELGWARWKAEETNDPATLAPIYLQTDSIPA